MQKLFAALQNYGNKTDLDQLMKFALLQALKGWCLS